MKRIALALAAVVLALTTATAATPAEADPSSAVSGYVGWTLNGPGSGNGGPWEGATATFVVPTVDQNHGCNPSPNTFTDSNNNVGSWMPIWVGLAGTGRAFTQVGIILNYNGTAEAFAEWFNSDGSAPPSIGPNNFTINPGDTIKVREQWDVGHSNIWFVWHNLTTGQLSVIEKALPNAYGGAQAQFYLEDPYDTGSSGFSGGEPLPWFGTMTLTNTHASHSTSSLDSNGVPTEASDTQDVQAAQSGDNMLSRPAYGGTPEPPNYTTNNRLTTYRDGSVSGKWYVNQHECN